MTVIQEEMEEDFVQHKPSLALPKEAEDPSHPLHYLFEYFSKNEEIRNEAMLHSLPLQQPANDFQISRTSFVYSRLPDPGTHLRIPPEFLLQHNEDFKKNRETIFHLKKTLQVQPFILPQLTQFRKMVTKSPTLESIASASQKQLKVLLDYCEQICKEDFVYSTTFMEWIYSLLLLLPTPVDAETSCCLHSTLKYMCRARHAIMDLSDSHIPYYQVIIATIGIFYGQSSDEDCL